MIKANFSAYSKYVTDSLNQWDLNRTLQVTGLNLTVKPEVHFSNAKLGGAIVVQADLVNHVVTVPIPNSLLQDPLRIYAHIGVYDGDEFKVVELVEIPVIPRKRPNDYELAVDDFELYSFKRLENEMANCLQRSDVVDHLYSTDGGAPLSANQGRVLASKAIPKKLSACVVFSAAYQNNNGDDFIASSMVPLANAEEYSSIVIGDVNIIGLANTMGASRFTVSPYGVGFALCSTDERAIQTVAGKAVSFEFTLTE